MKRVSFDSYELLQIAPVSGVEAIYAVAQEVDGSAILDSWPIDAIGVAKVTTRYFEYPDVYDGTSREYKKPTFSREVVGLQLNEGWYSVCNEADNFAGLMKTGQNREDSAGCLDREKYTLRPRLSETALAISG